MNSGRGSGGISSALQLQSQLILRLGKLRLKLSRRLQVKNRLVALVVFLQHARQVVVTLCIVRLQLHGALQEGESFIVRFLLPPNHTQMQFRRGVIGLQPQRFRELGSAFIHFAVLG